MLRKREMEKVEKIVKFLDTFWELCNGRRLAVGVLRDRSVGTQGVEKGEWGSNAESTTRGRAAVGDWGRGGGGGTCQ
jgi:hypothetical protein